MTCLIDSLLPMSVVLLVHSSVCWPVITAGVFKVVKYTTAHCVPVKGQVEWVGLEHDFTFQLISLEGDVRGR